MIRDAEYLMQFEEGIAPRLVLTLDRAFELVEAMWEEGVSLGVLPPSDPLEGIEVDLRVARALNSCTKSC